MPQCLRILLFGLLAHAGLVNGQENPGGHAALNVNPAALQAHTEFLAGDLLEGRASGSRGYELAASYVMAQFRQYGLAPAGNAGGYLQTVPLLEATAVLPGSAAVLRKDNEEIKFEYGRDFLPSADFLASNSSLSAPLAFAGFGVTAPELNYDDLANVDVQGHIAVVLSQAPGRFNSAQRAYYAMPQQKYANLIRHGASGLVIIDAPASSSHPWERRVAMSWMPQLRRLDADNLPIDVQPELKLSFEFSNDAAAKLFAGSGHSLEQVFAAAASGDAQGFALPGILTLSAVTGLRRTESSNVVGVLRGSDPKLRNEFVVLSAHLDHLGRGPAVSGDSIYNGAQDNAVGIGILLEAARVLAGMNPRPKRSIVFAAVTAAERGSLGAEHLLQFGEISPDTVVAAVNIDMPLAFARSDDLIALGAEQSSLGRFAADAAQAQGLRLASEDRVLKTSLLDDEALAFVKQGIPAVALKNGNRARTRKIDLPEIKRDFMQNHYRQPSDDNNAAPTDYAAAAQLAAANAHLARAVADAPARPHWYRDSFFYKKFRTRAGNE